MLFYYRKWSCELSDAVAKLKSENDFLKRHIFGKKSERFIAAPGQLSFEGLDAQLPEVEKKNPSQSSM
jgi:hypothetical protein